MSTEGTDDEAAAQVDAEEPTEVEDLLEDPRTDMEALCLCTLLWASTEETPGPQGELPGGVHRAPPAGREHGDAVEFCRRDGGGCRHLRPPRLLPWTPPGCP